MGGQLEIPDCKDVPQYEDSFGLELMDDMTGAYSAFHEYEEPIELSDLPEVALAMGRSLGEAVSVGVLSVSTWLVHQFGSKPAQAGPRRPRCSDSMDSSNGDSGCSGYGDSVDGSSEPYTPGQVDCQHNNYFSDAHWESQQRLVRPRAQVVHRSRHTDAGDGCWRNNGAALEDAWSSDLGRLGRLADPSMAATLVAMKKME